MEIEKKKCAEIKNIHNITHKIDSRVRENIVKRWMGDKRNTKNTYKKKNEM